MIDPTTSTLNVRWDPAEGNVREYIVIRVPTTGGEQEVVRPPAHRVDLSVQIQTTVCLFSPGSICFG